MADSKVQPRAPARARGLTRFATLLDAADAVLENLEPTELTIQDVATRAGVPLASMYHYFPSNAAVLIALAQRYLTAIEARLNEPFDHDALHFWSDIVRQQLGRVWSFFGDRPVGTKLLFGGILSQIHLLDAELNARIGRRHLSVYHRHFVLPNDESLVDRCIISITMSDAIGALSYRRHGRLVPEMAQEALQARLAYLRLFLPERAPKRPTPLP